MRTRLLLLMCTLSCADEPANTCEPGELTLAPPSIVFVGEPTDLGVAVPSGPCVTDATLQIDNTTLDEVATGQVHTFDRAGPYTLTLSVDQAGDTDIVSARVTAVHRPLERAPGQSSTVQLAGDRVLVVAPDLGTLSFVNVADFTLAEQRPLCPNPAKLAVRDTLVAVICAESEPGVVLLDGTTETARLPLDGYLPTGVVFTDDEILVSARVREDNTGRILHLSHEGALLEVEQVGADLRGLAWADEPVAVRYRSPDAQGELWWGEDWQPRTLSPNEGPDSDTSSRGVPNLLEAVAFSPSGTTLAIGGLRANMDRGLARDGLPLTHDSTTRATLRLIDREGVEQGRGRLDNRDLVSAVAWSPSGEWLYVAYLGMRSVETLSPFTMALSGSRLDVGDGLDGLATDGEHLYVHARYSRTLVRIPVDGAELGVPESLSLLGAAGEPWDAARIRGARIFHDASTRAMSRDGYASCGSCHPHGEDDGRTWDFTDRGEGLRNTITLRGMSLHGEGPIHWSANFDEVQDFEADIRGPQQGSGFLADDLFDGDVGPSLGEPKTGLSPELDDMAAYVLALDPIDLPSTPDGRDVFVSAGCDTCHPDGGTDSRWLADGEPLLHDVGTLTDDSGMRLSGPLLGLDTPSLRGVWATPPYLHDGRAETLEEVLTTHNEEDLHGVTSDLDTAELDRLLRYLYAL